MTRVIFGALIVIAILFVIHKRFAHLPLQETQAISTTASQTPSKGVDLVNDQGFNKIYNLSEKDRETLLKAVEHFCVHEYHRDSCIHHLITCGNPCLVRVPKSYRKRILADYERLRKDRGLPPIKRVED